MKLRPSDRYFLYSIPVYVAIGTLDIIFGWYPVELNTAAWILYLAVGVLYFRLWKRVR